MLGVSYPDRELIFTDFIEYLMFFFYGTEIGFIRALFLRRITVWEATLTDKLRVAVVIVLMGLKPVLNRKRLSTEAATT